MTHRLRRYRRMSTSQHRCLDICQQKRTKLLPPCISCYQDKSPLITNCVILLVRINFSPTGYFSLLSGKHLSTWNYYCARASGETQTVVNLMELWEGLSSLDGQSTGGAEGPILALYWVLKRRGLTCTSLASSCLALVQMAAIDSGLREWHIRSDWGVRSSLSNASWKSLRVTSASQRKTDWRQKKRCKA